jgi:hypothetical protein
VHSARDPGQMDPQTKDCRGRYADAPIYWILGLHASIRISVCMSQIKTKRRSVGIIRFRGVIGTKRLDGNDVDFHFKPMASGRQDHALDRGDVRVVSSSGDDNMVVLD